MRADDALKYAAAMLKECTDGTLDAIDGSDCSEGHEYAVKATRHVVREIVCLVARFGNPHRYHDCRCVWTRAEIQPGFVTDHVGNPDPAEESPQCWRGDLPSGDPGVQSPGVYEVHTDPATQTVRTRVVRIE